MKTKNVVKLTSRRKLAAVIAAACAFVLLLGTAGFSNKAATVSQASVIYYFTDVDFADYVLTGTAHGNSAMFLNFYVSGTFSTEPDISMNDFVNKRFLINILYTRDGFERSANPLSASVLDFRYAFSPEWFGFIHGNQYTLTLQIMRMIGIFQDYALEAEINIPFTYIRPPNVVPFPSNPTLEHHDFAGWYFDEDLTQPYDGSVIYEGTHLYAKFTLAKYTVTYVTNYSVTMPPIQVEALSLYVPATLDRYGCIFMGWYHDGEFTIPHNPAAPVLGPMTLHAYWEVQMVTVTFCLDGNVYTSLSVPYGTTLTSAANVVQKAVGAPLAWYLDPNMDYSILGSSELEADMVLYGAYAPLSEPIPDETQGTMSSGPLRIIKENSTMFIVLGAVFVVFVFLLTMLIKGKVKS